MGKIKMLYEGEAPPLMSSRGEIVLLLRYIEFLEHREKLNCRTYRIADSFAPKTKSTESDKER